MSVSIQEDCIGTEIRITFVEANGSVISLAGASTVNVIFKSPSNATTTRTATLYTDGTDGKITYTTVSGDFDAPGDWYYQGKATIGSTVLFTKAQKQIVKANLV